MFSIKHFSAMIVSRTNLYHEYWWENDGLSLTNYNVSFSPVVKLPLPCLHCLGLDEQMKKISCSDSRIPMEISQLTEWAGMRGLIWGQSINTFLSLPPPGWRQVNSRVNSRVNSTVTVSELLNIRLITWPDTPTLNFLTDWRRCRGSLTRTKHTRKSKVKTRLASPSS